MQNTKIVQLDENRAVTVRELRVRDVRHLVSEFSYLQNVDVKVLLTERFPELAELTKPLLVLPEGETLEDLTGSEIEAVVKAVLEVNQAFLALAGLDHLAAMLPDTSTWPVADSSNADTPTSSTTAGGSSSPRPAEPAN